MIKDEDILPDSYIDLLYDEYPEEGIDKINEMIDEEEDSAKIVDYYLKKFKLKEEFKSVSPIHAMLLLIDIRGLFLEGIEDFIEKVEKESNDRNKTKT